MSPGGQAAGGLHHSNRVPSGGVTPPSPTSRRTRRRGSEGARVHVRKFSALVIARDRVGSPAGPAGRDTAAVDGPALVSACLPQIQQAIAFVCRQRRLTRDEAHDLASDVHVRLLQHDAAVLRRYRGESSLHTFLVVVIQRVLLDARIARAGKWRPSAVARRLGRVAIHLERLVFYDGLSLAEAGPLVREHTGATHTDDELHFLLMLLPARRRRRMVGERELRRDSQWRRTPRTVSTIEEGAARRRAVARALAGLSDEDRRIVGLRFSRGWRLCEIARVRWDRREADLPALRAGAGRDSATAATPDAAAAGRGFSAGPGRGPRRRPSRAADRP